jgi:hypothetical protein
VAMPLTTAGLFKNGLVSAGGNGVVVRKDGVNVGAVLPVVVVPNAGAVAVAEVPNVGAGVVPNEGAGAIANVVVVVTAAIGVGVGVGGASISSWTLVEKIRRGSRRRDMFN